MKQKILKANNNLMLKNPPFYNKKFKKRIININTVKYEISVK